MSRQLPLGIRLSGQARFETFHPGPNAEAVAAVRRLASGEEGGGLYLWGAPGSGRSHLLQAACRAAGEAVYLPLASLCPLGVGALDGVEHSGLVCLDELEAVAGEADWERALFDLFNRVREGGGRLLAAAGDRPERIGLGLPDLVSRLGWGLVYGLKPLDDAGRIEALRLHAAARGLELPEEVGRYLIRRWPRDLTVLGALLEELDRASLVAQRRLTVPFVKAVLEPPRAEGD
ncbi:DnaA regulatory inactivator Hda [Thiohalobacter sp. IOR34]|uniref:DnaA regulatory inactivator Hda n=1 Tax=Thiohalobacter sp. IOR34 TaxID=3057176 RepID=UPI0025B03923|nr:DnaA regulatory inactivator Hda [Thiohalobacter sp. IOR34]WJW76066.1 DnaA regulatory inactivator Hda [Thiohalobacter sp. IOR34]